MKDIVWKSRMIQLAKKAVAAKRGGCLLHVCKPVAEGIASKVTVWV